MIDKKNVTKEQTDELTARIINRLAERKYKINKMQGWERPARRFLLIKTSVTFLAVACVAMLIIFTPWNNTSTINSLGMKQPDMTQFRSAAPDIAAIAKLLDKADYDAALAQTEKALRHSDIEIEELYNASEIWDDDEAQYEEEQEKVLNSELRWTYIYLLIKAERIPEAKKELKRYLKYPKYAEHTDEARQILKELKKDKK